MAQPSEKPVRAARGAEALRTAKRTGPVLLLALLAGCALTQGPDEPNETYDLIAPERPGGGGSTNAQLLVKEPTALRALNSDRIVLKPSPYVITYVADAQWNDTAPKLIQARLVEAFQNTARTGATAKPGDGLVIDYQLVSDLRRFEIDGSTNEAVLEIAVKLLADRNGKVVETRIFEARVPATSADREGYVRALDDAFDAVATRMIAWVLGTV